MKTLAPNTLLQNRYLVVQLIGKGGMGEVYLAFDQRLGSAVALKRTFFSDDEMLGNAFEREARTLARLRHPVLPKVSDHFTENDTQYLAMEHISGDDLSKRLEISDKAFPLSWVLFWSDQLLDALAYLHSQEPPIVHRDIKPQNLKLSSENHIVLLDFGLAKNSIGNTRVTSTGGSIVGYTPHYAPMEQIRGTGTNPRSDLYSLAATVYQLLTNTVPPDALTRADSILNGLPDPTKPLNEVNSEIPKAISDVILKAMSLSMDQRYTDAREMQKVLREAYAGMQSAMSAQTIAFDNSAAPPQSEDIPAAVGNLNSEQNNYPLSANIPLSAQSDSFSAAQNQDSPINFDATVKESKRSSAIKTEVLPKDKMPRTDDYHSSFSAKRQAESKADDFSFAPEDDFSSLSNAGEKEFDPGSTLPFIKLDNKDTAAAKGSDFGLSASDEQGDASSSEKYNPGQSFAVAETAAPVRETPVSNTLKTAAPKKSGGKSVAIAAGVGGFAVVAIGAAAIGWYALKPTVPTVEPTPTPPIVQTTATPVAEPTVEPTIESDINTANSAEVTTSSSPDVTDTQKQAVSADNPRPQNDRTGQKTPVRTSRTISSTTDVPRPGSAATPSPTKQPVKNSRTDILQ